MQPGLPPGWMRVLRALFSRAGRLCQSQYQPATRAVPQLPEKPVRSPLFFLRALRYPRLFRIIRARKEARIEWMGQVHGPQAQQVYSAAGRAKVLRQPDRARRQWASSSWMKRRSHLSDP